MKSCVWKPSRKPGGTNKGHTVIECSIIPYTGMQIRSPLDSVFIHPFRWVIFPSEHNSYDHPSVEAKFSVHSQLEIKQLSTISPHRKNRACHLSPPLFIEGSKHKSLHIPSALHVVSCVVKWDASNDPKIVKNSMSCFVYKIYGTM